jgi:two-component system, OmpR family, phosphate regulon response regulator PhoB
MLLELLGFGRKKKREKGLVLHVDDDLDILAMIRAVLEWMGLEVVSVADPTQGLRIAQEQEPDLVILDVRMPRLSGLDLCLQLKKLKPSMPILMVSAAGQMKDVEQALANGANGYVVKPIDIPQFKQKVSSMLKLPAPPDAAA